jgi:acyl-CoA synthetase (NDP forming)
MTAVPRPDITAARMRGLFEPRSIALVGASDNSVRSHATLDNLARGGFAGEVYLVNPRRDTAHGRKTYPSLTSLPETVDLAYLIVGRDSVPTVMADAAEAGIVNLATISAGFAEAGPEGAQRQEQLTRFAYEHGQLVFGPNNLGFVNAAHDVMAFSTRLVWPFPKGGVAIVSQSGAMCRYALDYFVARDIGVSCMMTTGNEAVINVANAMEYLVDDPATRVIALYLESIRQPDEFRRAATRAFEMGKPVVACKIGHSALGARAAAAHTGGLVGDDAVIDAAFAQLGVIRVDSMEDLIVTAGTLESYGVLRGNRVGFVTSSGALTAVISDIAQRDGIQLVDFSPETVEDLRAILPPFATAQNPLDVTGQSAADFDLTNRAEEIVAQDPNLDVVVLLAPPPVSEEELNPTREAILRRTAETVKKARAQVVVSAYLMADYGEFTHRFRTELGFPMPLPGIEKGLPALARALKWSERFRTSAHPGAVPPIPAPVVAAASADGSGWSEQRAREHLAAAGVPVVPGELVATPDEAAAAAARLGYPVVLKAVAASLLHKSDIGAVVLNIADEDALRGAYCQVTEAAAGVPDLDGVLVCPMRTGGIEMIVGVVRDPSWGPVLAVGLGGVWAEVMRDVARRLLPVDAAEITRMLHELKAISLLRGARGQEPADLERLAEVISRIGAAALSLGDRLDALEVNPLRVSGHEVEALDALVTWRE